VSSYLYEKVNNSYDKNIEIMYEKYIEIVLFLKDFEIVVIKYYKIVE